MEWGGVVRSALALGHRHRHRFAECKAEQRQSRRATAEPPRTILAIPRCLHARTLWAVLRVIDVWSLGIVLLELQCRRRVLVARDRRSLLQQMAATLGPLPADLVHSGRFGLSVPSAGTRPHLRRDRMQRATNVHAPALVTRTTQPAACTMRHKVRTMPRNLLFACAPAPLRLV